MGLNKGKPGIQFLHRFLHCFSKGTQNIGISEPIQNLCGLKKVFARLDGLFTRNVPNNL